MANTTNQAYIKKTEILKLLQFNANGVIRQKLELELLLNVNDIDICCLCETKLKPHHKTFTIPGYVTYRSDRIHSTGGGTAVLIKKSLSHSQILLPPLNSLEVCAINLQLTNKNIMIASAYLSTSRKFDTTDLDILQTINSTYILLGDFNAKHPDWNIFNPIPNTAGLALSRYLNHHPDTNILASHQPTRPVPALSIIDIGITKNINYNYEIDTLNALNSDHLPVKTTIKLREEIHHYIRKPQQKDYDWNRFTTFLSNNTPKNPPCDSQDEIDLAVDKLTGLITTALTLSQKRIPSRSHQTQLPRQIVDLIKHKNNLRKQFCRSHDPKLKTKINQLKKQLTTEIQNYRNETVSRLSASHPEDPFFVPRLFLRKPTVIPPLQTPGGLAITDSEKANLYAQYLTTIFHPNPIPPPTQNLVQDYLDNSNLNTPLPADTDPMFFTPSEIRTAILKLNPKKAPGIDDIPSFILRHLPPAIYLYLTKLFNSCLRLTHYPTAWRTAKIIPIPKPKKPKNIPSSYRPINLLSCIAKILDTLLLGRIQSQLDRLKTINKYQFGFRDSHSTSQQLFRVGETITTNINRGQYTGFVALDLEKAFDKVWHPGLLYKLLVAGISIRIVKMIQSYISNRHFRVAVNRSCSISHPSFSGVPQGSALGPVLFNLYVNDIPKPTDHRTTLCLYADDTAILTTSVNPTQMTKLLQTQTDTTIKFYQDWGLSTNTDKTQPCYFTTKRKKLPTTNLTINNQPKLWLDKVDYLGVNLDRKLKFKQHIKNITKKYNSRLRSMYGILKNSPLQTTTLFYKMYLRPLLVYASPVWYPLISRTHQHKLQTLQNQGLKTCKTLSRLTPTQQVHDITGTPTLSNFIYNRLIPNFTTSIITSENPTLPHLLIPKFATPPTHPSLNYLYKQ